MLHLCTSLASRIDPSTVLTPCLGQDVPPDHNNLQWPCCSVMEAVLNACQLYLQMFLFFCSECCQLFDVWLGLWLGLAMMPCLVGHCLDTMHPLLGPPGKVFPLCHVGPVPPYRQHVLSVCQCQWLQAT